MIVGVGQVNDRPARVEDGLDPPALMAEALRRADADAGGGWLPILDSLAVVQQISFPGLSDMAPALAERLGARPRHCATTDYPGGDRPLKLLSEAANRIGAGEISVAAVAGGEALRTAAARGLADAARAAAMRAAPSWRAQYGLVAPTDIYPLYENASRAAWGQTLAEAQAESGAIWARLSAVAAANPDAWLRRVVPEAEIVTPTESNRPVAFPYTKLMVANAAVNQGAGFILCSLAVARARGVPEERLVFVGHAAAAREAEDPLARDRYDRSASLTAVLRHALAANELDDEDPDDVELYSCFPCIPKLARRVLDWPIKRPVSVVGGLTFGGGPIGNYMSHAVARMTQALRAGGRRGLLFGNGGYATYNHALVLSRVPPAVPFPRDFDVQAAADGLRDPVPEVQQEYLGPAAIETYTVLFGRDGKPARGVMVARTPSGRRTLAAVPAEDAGTIGFLTDGRREPVGCAGTIRGGDDGLQLWSPL